MSKGVTRIVESAIEEPRFAVDYWHNDQRTTKEHLMLLCSRHKWTKIRDCYLVSENASLQIEAVGSSVLVWLTEHACLTL